MARSQTARFSDRRESRGDALSCRRRFVRSTADCSHIRFCVTSLKCANGCAIAYSGAKRKLRKRPARYRLRLCSQRISTRNRRRTVLLKQVGENKFSRPTNQSRSLLSSGRRGPDLQSRIHKRIVPHVSPAPKRVDNADVPADAVADEVAEAAAASRLSPKPLPPRQSKDRFPQHCPAKR